MEIAQISFNTIRQIGVGQGQNSKVYLSHDPQLGGELVVKKIPKDDLGNSLDEYFREAKILFATEHPNVVPIQYACATKDEVCLAMRYFPHKSLGERIANGPIQIGAALKMGREVLSGLAHVHAQGFLHLDIKPTNILFSDTDTAMIADFGQARALDHGVVQFPRMYEFACPPEVVNMRIASHGTDIYQAGLLLYRAVNGDPTYKTQLPDENDPFRGFVLSKRITTGKFPDRNGFLPHIPGRLRTIIRKALKIQPSERYASASEMADALARVSAGLNWIVTSDPHTGTTWTADRIGQPSLVVRLAQAGSAWKVEVCTSGPDGCRARNKAEFWRSNLDPDAAGTHLETVFSALE